ncbi:MAG: DEAD/DEAH box helicase family protein, partial [Deltaproteobacteria bacterium]|nr:DEAD/DEAH box helicase family protein [Deltaproteobacteria bacterium]
MWKIGSKLIHPFNPELGVGVVRKIDGRFLQVHFPEEGRELTLSPQSSGITRLILPAGSAALLLASDEEVVIAEAIGHAYRLEDGREVEDAELWPLLPADTPLERVATGRLDSVESFCNRVEGLHLSKLREAGGLGSFLGGRIQLFAHQLYTAQQAVSHDPVRWLLADEVGLGKTVEACLILSALLRTGRAERALLVVPDTLAVQWLGELYRKFHQVFVLLDEKRLESVATDFGEEANPFEIHPFAVISQEQLLANPKLCLLAMMAELDLVVVDEAHRLSNEPIDDVVRPLVSMSTHALLLTATPLQADHQGFFELLSMLHPDDFCSFEDFETSLEKGGARVPCTSSVRRADVGGLPPRVTFPIDLPAAQEELRNDPRAQWLMDQARIWAKDKEKALVFVRDVETLLALQELLEARVHLRIPVFHEGLDPATRDIEVANFRDSLAPILLCSEAGGEGRNFQFCDRMVHFDLPLDPVILEQRIGRLDRIGRISPVEIVYFRLEGEALDVAGLYERLDLFGRPAAGLDRALAPVRSALAGAKRGVFSLDIDKLCSEVEEERQREGQSVIEVFYPDAYHHGMESEVLDQVPEELDSLTQKVCL